MANMLIAAIVALIVFISMIVVNAMLAEVKGYSATWVILLSITGFSPFVYLFLLAAPKKGG